MIKLKNPINKVNTVQGPIDIVWPIKIIDQDKKNELFGLTNYNEIIQIAIQKGLDKRVAQQTLMHELIHMYTMPFSIELTEHEVEIIATQIIHMMKNNPQLVKYLTEK